MARITVEDCITKVEDRFELVVLASKRAKELHSGTPAFVARDDDKNTIIALREIEEDKLNIPELRKVVVLDYRNNVPLKDLSEYSQDLEFIEKELLNDIVLDTKSIPELNNVSEEELKNIV